MIIDGVELPVIIEKKRIKNIYFRVNENLEIYVTCPKYVSKLEINHLLKSNEKALTRMYRKIKNKTKDNEKILLLGNELEFVQYKRVMFDKENNRAYGPSVEKVNEYLEKKSLKVFEDRLKLYIDTFDNLPKFRLRTRKMKTRWGVCNRSSMTVTLNTLLIHKKPYLIDYVICHELSHWSHMDHSRAFWKCVEEHFPDYKKARKELKD